MRWLILVLLVLASCAPVLPDQVQPKAAPSLPVKPVEILQGDRTLSEAHIATITKGLKSGGPPKNGIPAVDKPVWIDPQDAQVKEDELVFGMLGYGEPRAVPSSILFWHEIVNAEGFSLTWCPLTGTAIGFKDINLGVSGKLYNSNLVMYDRKTDSEIPQIYGIGINKELKGKSLEQFRVYQTTWKQWKAKYPNTKILSRNTGHDRNYDRSPYPGYETAYRLLFPVDNEDDRFDRKAIVHGIENNGEFMAILLKDFIGEKDIQLGGDTLHVLKDEALGTLIVTKDDKLLPSFDAYWFAWYAFHPDTEVWENNK